ncbi:MAG: sigma-70 family RNA polymerase sigma factor [Sedimentisphaerales bacterium]|nr:sigma-70 family RNA polymerase sigma factor [Sedimentisphaerales bacterium]
MTDRQKELLELLDKSGANLYTLLTRLTLREDVAEELMQELFIKLNRSHFDKAANKYAYARKTAINLAFERRRNCRLNPVGLDQISEPVSGNISPLNELIRTEELDEILNAIGKLKKLSREAFVMRYIEQESYDYIAEQLGKSTHHIRAVCSRASNRLRDILERNHSQSFKEGTDNVENRRQPTPGPA